MTVDQAQTGPMAQLILSATAALWIALLVTLAVPCWLSGMVMMRIGSGLISTGYAVRDGLECAGKYVESKLQ